MRQSSATWICVIDGDLQHPPEAIPDLYARVREGSEVDLIIGSRNLEGGKQALTGVRNLVSQSTGFLAKVLFPASLKAVTDPMSGFFLMHRQSIPMDDLRPNGFKLLLEILVRGRNLRVLEVPYHFQTRENGKSKFGVHEGPRFAALIWALRGRAAAVSALFFFLVGLTGYFANIGSMWLLTDSLHLRYVASAIAATQVSSGWNLVLIGVLVFPGRSSRSFLGRAGRFFLILPRMEAWTRMTSEVRRALSADSSAGRPSSILVTGRSSRTS